MTAILATLPQIKTRLYAILLMGLSVFLWAVMEMMGSLLPSTYSPYQTVWMRYATHLLFMLAVLGPRYRGRLVQTPRLGMQLLRSLLMLGMPIFFITALYHMPATEALTIFWVAPLIALGLSSVLLAERTSRLRWLVSLASFVGVLLILRPAGNLWHWSLVLPLGMAFCFSLYQVMTRMMQDEDTLASLFYTALGVFILLSFGLPFFWQPLTLSSGLVMMAIGLLGFLGLFTLDRSLELAPVSAVAPFAYTQPIWMSGFSSVLIGHTPGRAAMLGIVIIISSGIFLIIKDY